MKMFGSKRLELPEWFRHEMPLSKVPIFGATVSTLLGAAIGICCSMAVNCALVEISTSPFFTTYFGLTFLVIGIAILWRLTVAVTDKNGRERSFLRFFGFTIIASGVICFFLKKSWFVHSPYILKISVYTLMGISISFALTFTIVDLINYFISMFETSVARPLVESKPQVYLILFTAITMGALFGFIFGFMDVEDEVEYHIRLALIKEESRTWPIGLVLGAFAGFGNNYLRLQEYWQFSRDNSYDVEI